MLRSLAKEYVRVKSGQLKHNVITDTFLNLEFNLSTRKVQTDIFSFLNIKHFTKQAVLAGPYPAVPADLFTVPDSIIDMKSSTGVRATATTGDGGTNDHVTVTMIEPGLAGNAWSFVLLAATVPLPAGTVTVDFVGLTITVYITTTVTTGLVLVSYVQASRTASMIVTIALKAGENGTGAIPTVASYIFSNGLGSGYIPSREISPEDYNRISGISLLAPSDLEPAFMLIGDSAGVKGIQMIPTSITWSLCMYKYVATDLTLDTQALAIPPEYEELVLLNVLEKIFEQLAKSTEEQEKAQEYELKKKEYFDSYQAAFQTKTMEKKRMKVSDEDK